MKIALFGLALLGFLATNRVEAGAILYSTTDLGGGFYKLQYNPDGSTYGLTKSDGSVTYAFDKLPTTSIDIHTGTSQSSDPNQYHVSQTLTLQNGSYQVGYATDLNYYDAKNHGVDQGYVYPTFEPHSGSWISFGGGLYSPVSDLNSQGQDVGKSWILGTNPNDLSDYYAAFSANGAQPHGGDAAVTDNLNNYIATIPGVSLISANQIDELGRIIAVGSDGEDYLLTPASLGAAATVPEPTSLTTLAVGILIAVVQMSRNRFRRI